MNDIWGQAIADYHYGNTNAMLLTETQYTEADELPVAHLFREFADMPLLEQQALDLCSGKVLDVGCGAGSHALYLQDNGMQVIGLDRSPGSIAVSKERGLKQTVCSALLDYKGERFDTLLMLMNGSGIFETVAKVPVYLEHLKTLLNPGGQILIDSSDLQYLFDRNEDGSIWVPAHRYYGELDFKVHYNGQSQEFPWLYLDPALFERLCKQTGWKFELLKEGEHYDYLARLSFDQPDTQP